MTIVRRPASARARPGWQASRSAADRRPREAGPTRRRRFRTTGSACRPRLPRSRNLQKEVVLLAAAQHGDATLNEVVLGERALVVGLVAVERKPALLRHAARLAVRLEHARLRGDHEHRLPDAFGLGERGGLHVLEDRLQLIRALTLDGAAEERLRSAERRLKSLLAMHEPRQLLGERLLRLMRLPISPHLHK